MSDEAEDEPGGGDAGGGAGWLATFADLMSLLMCFFVLLLSFSEMDVLKFKRLAGSMKSAFGVQAQYRANDIPKGTSIIAQEFSPGRPEPTPLNEIWQKTTDESRNSLEVACQDLGASNTGESGDAQKMVVIDEVQDLVGQTEEDAIELASALAEEIAEGVLEVETKGRQITIRIKEYGTFPSGSAELTANFKPILKIIREQLETIEGQIVVEGHTDDRPINTQRFRSNWALSSGRAVAVAHGLFDTGEVAQSRFQIAGYADTKPMVANSTNTGRARNRRVEIRINQGLSEEVKGQLEVLRAEDPGTFEAVRQEIIRRFELSPDEVF